MTDGDLRDEATIQETLDATIGGSISGRLKADIVDAFRAYGWDQSSGVRTVLRAWLESTQVRDAVVKHIHTRAAA